MGTYDKPGIIKDTRFQAARGASQQISKTIAEQAEKKKKAEEMIKLKQQKLNESMYGLQLDVSKVPASSDKSLTASLRKTLNTELQHIYQLGLDSLKTGDNSEYLSAKAKFEGWISKLPNQLGNLDYEANMYSKKGSQAMTYGNNPVLGIMLDNFNQKDGQDIEITYDRGTGVGIYSYEDMHLGKVDVNMDYNMKNIESGGSGLIKYIDDPTDRLGKLWTKASKGYKPYTFEQEEIGKTGQEVIATYQNYDDANEDIKNELMGVGVPNYKDPFENEYTQSNWEFFGFPGEFDSNSSRHKKELQEVMIDWMITNKGKRSETRTKEELLTKKNRSVGGSITQSKINSARAYGRRYFKSDGTRRTGYDGQKMAEGLNDARHTSSRNREKVKYFTVRDLLTTYSDPIYDEVRDWINNQNYALDDVLRADIGVLDSATAKITPTAVPNLFALMNSIDDFENSYKDFQAFK